MIAYKVDACGTGETDPVDTGSPSFLENYLVKRDIGAALCGVRVDVPAAPMLGGQVQDHVDVFHNLSRECRFFQVDAMNREVSTRPRSLAALSQRIFQVLEFPLEKLSATLTVAPFFGNWSTRWLPMKDALPVTSTERFSHISPILPSADALLRQSLELSTDSACGRLIVLGLGVSG